MNLAIHGIDGTQVGWNNESSLDKDLHQDLKADYIFCVPPLNSRYSEWMRYIVAHLATGGAAGVILSKDSLSEPSSVPAAAENRDDRLEDPAWARARSQAPGSRMATSMK